MPTLDEHVRAMYPALRMMVAVATADPRTADLPATFDGCEDTDKEMLRGIVRARLQEDGAPFAENPS